MLGAARDFWDWVVVGGVLAGVVLALVSVMIARVALKRGSPLFTVERKLLQSAPEPEHLEFHLHLGVTTPGVWRLKSYHPTVQVASRWPWQRRRIQGVRGMGQPFRASGGGYTQALLAWHIPRPDGVERLRITVNVRLHQRVRFRFREVFDVPPPP